MTTQSDLLQMAVEALEAALKALDAIGDEMTVGERYTNAGQHLIDALPTARAAIAAIRAAQQPKPSIGDTTARSGDVGASDLPPLPEPMKHGPFGGLFTATQMREYALAAMKGAKS